MTQYHIGYTFSDFNILPNSLEISAKSALSFLSKDKITAFYTPPCSDSIYNKINELIDVKKVPNITSSFATLPNGIRYHNGEKIHVSEISSENVLLMDCDTLIIRNPIEIFDEDFDFAVMELTKAQKIFENDNVWKSKWDAMFKKYDKKSRRYLPTSIVFGKNNIFKEIKEEFIQLMNEDLPHLENFYPKEEYALSMCASDKKVKYLPREILGAFEDRTLPFYKDFSAWQRESEPIIWHIGELGLNINF